jgi:hypothetical protein
MGSESSPFYLCKDLYMKITLNPSQSFWGLMDPIDLKVTLALTENDPVTEINESNLRPWEVKQIATSVKDKRISISLHVEDLLKSLPEDNKEQKKLTIKKATKRKA